MSGLRCEDSSREAPHPLADRRLAFVIPWRDEGQWLWEFLPKGFRGDLIYAAAETRQGVSPQKLPPYLGEFLFLGQRQIDWNAYDVIFAWELRSALATALHRRLSGKRRARFIAVGPILKGPVRKALPIVRWLLSDAERIVCFSSDECEEYSQLLRLPRERFTFLPTPWRGDEEETERDDGFVLALGQSNRDYGTLMRAVRDTNLPVVIVAVNSSALGGEEPSPNVTVLYNTNLVETEDLIAGATMHCIPLHAEGFSSGQTVLLRAMARGKATIVSDTPGIRDYVQNNETSVLVPPGDVEALRSALLRLWSDPAERQRLGKSASKRVREDFSFPRFTERLVEMVCSGRTDRNAIPRVSERSE